jgi:hypothetical protein
MYQSVLALLITAFCVDSLTVYGSGNIFLFNMSDQEREGNFHEPPPHEETARMARYIVHNSDWCVMAYNSQHAMTSGFPMGTLFSVSDGPLGNGKGTPYVYVSELVEAIQDLHNDSRCSFTMSLAQGDYCKQKKLDPQDPLCAQVTLVGRMDRVQNGTTDWVFAQDALFSRHPEMLLWPKDHNFFIMKLHIERIRLLDYFGGHTYVDVDDYYDVTP